MKFLTIKLNKTMKIAIAAAGGNIGSRTALKVADGKAEVVLLGRNRNALENLNIDNATIAETDISNANQVITATQGVDALFWLVPPVVNVASLKDWYHKVTSAGVAAVKANKIKKVVLVSTLGAAAAENLGTVTYAGWMEAEFDKLDADVLGLRPGYFMENFLLQADSIKQYGEFSFIYAPDHDIPFISADDIGDTAAKYLLDNTWSGHWKLNLMGPENITLEKVAQRLTAALSQPIKYKQSTMAEARSQLAGWGISQTVQQELTDLFAALGDPDGIYATPRTPEAHTPTHLEAFALKKLQPLIAAEALV
jgi:uncharacterized protein YbjT (DUF2867 family)